MTFIPVGPEWHHPFTTAYIQACENAGNVCAIEAGVFGRLADNECPHGRLPGDKSDPCGCWIQEAQV